VLAMEVLGCIPLNILIPGRMLPMVHVRYVHNQGIFVMERHSVSSFSEGCKPDRRYGTSFPWH
jgi:hypothetical protein